MAAAFFIDKSLTTDREITKPPELERMKIHTLRTIMFVMSQSERKKVCEVVIFRMRGAGLLSQKNTYYG